MKEKKSFKVKNVFIDDYLEGKTSCDDIDLYVEDWDQHDHYGVSLFEFLGISEQQYAKWCENPDSLENELKKIRFDR